MSVVAYLDSSEQAKQVVNWAGRCAAALDCELVIFYSPFGSDEDFSFDPAVEDSVYLAIVDAVEGVVRKRGAWRRRIPRHAVSIRRVSEDDQVAGILSRLRVEAPLLFVGAARVKNGEDQSPPAAKLVADRAPCDSIVLNGNQPSDVKPKRIVVATGDSAHDRGAIELAQKIANSGNESITILDVEASVGEEAILVGENQLRSLLREMGLAESSRLKVRAIVADNWARGICDQLASCDLLLVGAGAAKKLRKSADSAPDGVVGVFRCSTRLVSISHKDLITRFLPQINPADYVDLYDRLQAGSRWNSDFIVMLSLAAAIATLGLLQSSPAVVIGSMLLAPLMTPMIGMGLALNQGNPKLAYSSFRAIGRGFLAALAISYFLGIVTPGSDLTPEIVARAKPNLLDLLIAIFSGAAAAYALARPSLAGTIAGVAIATALVPPLCSCGIALAYQQFAEAVGALILLLANVLAIILAAAAMLRAMGLTTLIAAGERRVWVRRVVYGLTACMLAVSIHLGATFMKHMHQGKNAAFALAVTNETREALAEYLRSKPGVQLLFAGRAGIDRESDPVDVGIILSSTHPLKHEEADAIVAVIQETMQNPDLRVRVECVVSGWAAPSVGSKVTSDSTSSTDHALSASTD